MKIIRKSLLLIVFATILVASAVASAAEAVDPEFDLLYVTAKNEEHKLVLTTKDFLTDTDGVLTVRIFFFPGLLTNTGIRLHEVRAFEDEEGYGDNIFLYEDVVGGPVHHQYLISWVVNDVGFPEDMLPSPDKTGFGYGDKWYDAGLGRGVLYISLSAPANIKRIELEMGYSNKGLPLEAMDGIEIRVSKKSFTEEELTERMNWILENTDYNSDLL